MSRGTLDPASCNSDFTYGTFTLSGLTSQTVLLSYCSHVAVRTPERTRSGLGSSVFARRYSQNRCFFLFLRLLRCFSSAGWLSDYSERQSFKLPGSPIRISPDRFFFADPRRFSQLNTSFIASISLGIPRTPLHTFFFRLRRITTTNNLTRFSFPNVSMNFRDSHRVRGE